MSLTLVSRKQNALRAMALRQASSREHVEADVLARFAPYMISSDRNLLDLTIRRGLPVRQVGELIGLSAGTITRRAKRLLRALADPIVAFLVDPRCPVREEFRQLGLEHFLQLKTVGELAQLHNMPTHEVQQAIAFIRGWHKGITGAPRRG